MMPLSPRCFCILKQKLPSFQIVGSHSTNSISATTVIAERVSSTVMKKYHYLIKATR